MPPTAKYCSRCLPDAALYMLVSLPSRRQQTSSPSNLVARNDAMPACALRAAVNLAAGSGQNLAVVIGPTLALYPGLCQGGSHREDPGCIRLRSGLQSPALSLQCIDACLRRISRASMTVSRLQRMSRGCHGESSVSREHMHCVVISQSLDRENACTLYFDEVPRAW